MDSNTNGITNQMGYTVNGNWTWNSFHGALVFHSNLNDGLMRIERSFDEDLTKGMIGEPWPILDTEHDFDMFVAKKY